MPRMLRITTGFAGLALFCGSIAAAEPDAVAIAAAEQAIEAAIDDGLIPGAVLVIGDPDGVRYRKAFGVHQAGQPDPLRTDAIFDLASVTKPMATALAIAALIDDGKLSPDDRVGKHLPSYAVNGKESTTIAHLLTHRAGLPAANHLRNYADGPDEAMRRIDAYKPTRPPGERHVYSDLGYIVLGRIVEKVSGRTLDAYVAERIYGKLGLRDTVYNPPAPLVDRIVPTAKTRDGYLRGRVHDPRAAALGGVAGHAGLFSTADELALLCRMLLGGGAVDGERVLDATTVRRMLAPTVRPDGRKDRSLMWPLWTVDPRERNSTRRHSGFTGTMVWIDPDHRSFAVLLASRLQVGGADLTPLRQAVVVAADAAINDAKRENPAVLCGIDVLVNENFASLAGRRVGLITNHTGLDRFGRRTIDLLHNAPNVKLVSLLSPEHGLYGKVDEKVGHAIDTKTGLRVWSLYGDTKKPTKQMLADIDTLVFDIQDIGTRYYTYISTMGLAMEAAAEHNKRIVVLDRPNPIAPLGPRGPLPDADKLHFIAYHTLPVTHGLTVGELAKLFNAERKINADLRVVPMQRWNRSLWLDETGRRWVNPSPNMRSLTQATLYPAIGLLEMTNLSVGRGTDAPFERIGAPYIDGAKLSEVLNRLKLPGVTFEPLEYTPNASKFKGEACGGVRIELRDREAFDPVRTGLTIARVLHAGSKEFESDKLMTMLRSDGAHASWKTVKTPADMPGTWAAAERAFVKRAAPHLLYGPALQTKE